MTHIERTTLTERVCFHLSIIEGQSEPERMTLMIVDEEAGF